MISRRVQAALASGVLAFSAAAPAVTIAAGPDRQQEGRAAPEVPAGGSPHQPGSGDAAAPDFDPGGETPLPFEVGPAPSAPVTGGGSDDTGDGAPVDSEPVDDPEGRRLLATEPETEATVPESDTSVDEAPVPPAPPASGPVPRDVRPANPEVAPAPGTPAAPTAPVPALESEIGPNEAEFGRTRELTGTPESDRAPSTESGSVPSAPSQPLATTITAQGSPPASRIPVSPPTEPAPVVQAGASAQDVQPPPASNAGFHVVQSGESLWSIARALLGAHASPAEIAKEVHRLWELNENRIGTGDPDILRVGTRLVLR